MRITKRQLKRIIKEEKARILSEVTPGERADALKLSAEDMAAQPVYDEIDAMTKHAIERDMDELLQILDTAAVKANEIRMEMDNSNYAEWAGGREQDDLQLKLIKVWRAMGFHGPDL